MQYINSDVLDFEIIVSYC